MPSPNTSLSKMSNFALQWILELLLISVERIKSHCDPTSSKQTALTIREPSSANIQERICHEVNTLSSPSDQGKNAFQPFCVFGKAGLC
ncbi:hypothetical protein K7X08_021665 [Anisodus acutangulus]|uniref:Secreted protein n=1 Tax=Anisodus acutangulus TaxID=402998 RepID=A0A9Q1REK4_9SOLA|nr:hypothetical protein K7X08_021665 [Anisodus acutangulus]